MNQRKGKISAMPRPPLGPTGPPRQCSWGSFFRAQLVNRDKSSLHEAYLKIKTFLLHHTESLALTVFCQGLRKILN